jgi:MFS family permease
MTSVILGLYLAGIGLTRTQVGYVFASALAGGALLTIVLTSVADRWGRRRVVLLSAILMALSAAGFILIRQLPLLVVAAALGAVNPSSKDIGPFLSIEQAVLPQVSAANRRTATFATYNMVGSFSGAIGALLVGAPALLGLGTLAGYRAVLLTNVAVAAALTLLYTRLSPKVELEAPPAGHHAGLRESRGVVARLAGLFAVDAFAGAFVVQGIMAYWLTLRFGVSVGNLGAIFFGTNMASALSFLAAAPLARRIGLLNAMVFTHLPSNVLLLLVPLMPGLAPAVGVLLARNLLSQLDVPTRQSYVMAIVGPGERSAAAGVTAVARNAASAVAPAFTGATLAVPALGLPFLIAGTLKIGYDLTVLFTFRRLRPPEER